MKNEELKACPFCDVEMIICEPNKMYCKHPVDDCVLVSSSVLLYEIKTWNTRPTPSVKGVEGIHKVVDKVLKSYQLSHTNVEGEEDTNMPLTDVLCAQGSSDISTGIQEIEYITDDIIEALSPYLNDSVIKPEDLSPIEVLNVLERFAEQYGYLKEEIK